MGVTEIDGVNENEEMHITDVRNFYKTNLMIVERSQLWYYMYYILFDS